MELAKKVQNLFENGKKTRENMIQTALKSSYTMLSIERFIEVTGFKLNNILPFNLMWNSFRDNIPIYVTNGLIKVFGYKGEIKTQKFAMMKLVKKYNIPVIQLNNEEYTSFVGHLEYAPNNSSDQEESKVSLIEGFYPLITKEQLKSKPLHTLIMPKDLKKLWLVVNTSNGDMIRDYVISLDELFNLYLEYQSNYKSSQMAIKDTKIDELNNKIEKLIENSELQIQKLNDQDLLLKEMKEENEVQTEILDDMSSKLDKATDERAPRPKSANKCEQFLLIKLKGSAYWRYYVIRAQCASAEKSRIKIMEKYPGSTLELKIEYQPNAGNLYTLIKEQTQIKSSGNYIRLRDGYTNEQFITDITKINEERKEV